jgi:glycosyltransferase involved in cell wall biosynthesis
MHDEQKIENPLVTVITVTYNSSAYVRDAINSVLSQSYPNFQYIIADDCSFDDTWEIIQEYNDNRILSYRNEKNIGEYANRNKAILLAEGKYVYFIDGDDLMLYRGIEDTVKEMVRYPNCGFGVVRPENPKFIGPLEIERKDALQLDFFGGGVLDSSLSNNVFENSLLKKNLFLESYKSSDTYSRINLLRFADLLVLVSPIAVWRLTPNQASKKIDLGRQHLEFLNFCKTDLFVHPEYFFFSKDLLRRLYYRRLYHYVKMNKIKFLFSPKSISEYILDDWRNVFLFFFKKPAEPFWNEYNYENVNIYFKR